MAWTKATRAQHARDHLRYASSLTEAEWALIAPALPAPARLGRPRTTSPRRVVEALLYILTTGCQWRALPQGEFPPRQTVQRYFYAWRDTGVWDAVNRLLVEQARRALGRQPRPSLAIIDSPSGATTQRGGRALPPAPRRAAPPGSGPTAPSLAGHHRLAKRGHDREWRPARHERRQAGEGAQAPHRHRHARLPAPEPRP